MTMTAAQRRRGRMRKGVRGERKEEEEGVGSSFISDRHRRSRSLFFFFGPRETRMGGPRSLLAE